MSRVCELLYGVMVVACLLILPRDVSAREISVVRSRIVGEVHQDNCLNVYALGDEPRISSNCCEDAGLHVEYGVARRSEDQLISTAVDFSNAIVVADVVAVDLISIDGFDQLRTRGFGEEVSLVVLYRVTVNVRTVIKGNCGAKRFSFISKLHTRDLSSNGGWVFYKGITLQLGLSDENGVVKVDAVAPCLPYAPYNTGSVYLYGYDDVLPNTVFTLDERVRKVIKSRNHPLLVQYGNHTLMMFEPEVLLCSANRQVGLSIFGFENTAAISVWVKSGKGNFEYWKNAWFGRDTPNSKERLSAQILE